MSHLELIAVGRNNLGRGLAEQLKLERLAVEPGDLLEHIQTGPGGLILVDDPCWEKLAQLADLIDEQPYGVLRVRPEPCEPPEGLRFFDQSPLEPQSLLIHRAKALLERIWLAHKLDHNHRLHQEADAAASNERAVLGHLQTQLRQARDRAQSEAQEKSELINFLAHEIRTPLNGLMGLVHLFAQTNLDREQQEYLAALSNSGHSVLEMVNGLLDWGRLEAGKVELQPREFDLWALLDELRLWFLPLAEEKGLFLKVEASEAFGGWLYGDLPKLRQLLVNLIGNALKFTQEGGVTLTVEPRMEGERAAGLCLIVADTGEGIDEEQQKRLFDPFWQAQEFGVQGNQGSGLGLAIVQKLVEVLSGELQVRSQVGQGTQFELILPLSEVKRNRAEVAPKGDSGNSFLIEGEIYLLALEQHLKDGAWPEARDLVGRFHKAGDRLGLSDLSSALSGLNAALGREESAVHLAQFEEVERQYRAAAKRLTARAQVA